jgi:hypothetical protein
MRPVRILVAVRPLVGRRWTSLDVVGRRWTSALLGGEGKLVRTSCSSRYCSSSSAARSLIVLASW